MFDRKSCKNITMILLRKKYLYTFFQKNQVTEKDGLIVWLYV